MSDTANCGGRPGKKSAPFNPGQDAKEISLPQLPVDLRARQDKASDVEERTLCRRIGLGGFCFPLTHLALRLSERLSVTWVGSDNSLRYQRVDQSVSLGAELREIPRAAAPVLPSVKPIPDRHKVGVCNTGIFIAARAQDDPIILRVARKAIL